MRAVVQRVSHADVKVDGRQTGAIGNGLLVLVGVHRDDDDSDVSWLADKLVNLRIFEDDAGLMNLSILDTGGEILLVSQFTLLGDCRKGRRPSWTTAATPDYANQLYLGLIREVGNYGVHTASGEFQAMMEVHLLNDGPVTLMLDSKKDF